MEAAPGNSAYTFAKTVDQLVEVGQSANPTLAGVGSPIPESLVVACVRLMQVLAALRQDPSVAQGLDPRELAKSADTVVREANDRETGRQRTVLQEALAGVPSTQLHRAAGSTWLVLAPAADWIDLTAAFAAISRETRLDLGARVVGAATDGDAVLPLAMQLMTYGEPAELPITLEMLAPLVQSVDLSLRQEGTSAQALMKVVNDLVQVSWDRARVRARPADWPIGPDFGTSDLTSIRVQGASAAAAFAGTPFAESIVTAFDSLIDQVANEGEAENGMVLAGELLDWLGRPVDEGPAPPLWQALSTVSAAGLHGTSA